MPKRDQAYLEARRNEILEAAVVAFARSGFQESTIQDIAQEAGVSHGAIYRYFASKDDIIEAVASHRDQSRDERFARAERSAQPGEELLGVLRNYILVHGRPEQEDHARVRMDVFSEAVRNPRVRSVLLDAWEDVVGRFSEMVRRGQEQGAINPALDAGSVARVITALHDGIYIHQTIEPSLDTSAFFEVIGALLDGTFRVKDAEGSSHDESPLHTESERDIAT